MSTVSSSSSLTTSGSPSTSTSTPSGTSTFFSQTFTAPPTPTDGGNNGGGSFNNPSVASSASLYLYTFLATLVLLLSVSAAIILRSFLLRRRHRRMVEEAIRNGTWIPPSPTGLGFGFGGRSGGGRIDPGSKPRLWEAYVEKKDPEMGYTETEGFLDSMRPFAAHVATSGGGSPAHRPPQPPMPQPPAEPEHTDATNTTTNDTNPATERRAPLSQRIRQYINPTPPTLFLSPHERNAASHNTNTSGPNVNEIPLPPGPQTIRVSVLIAMPSQSRPQTPQYRLSTSKAPSPMPYPSPASSRPPTRGSVVVTPESTPLGLPRATCSRPGDQELPHLEFGLAEITVREESKEDEDEEMPMDAPGRADGKRPLSMGSSLM